MVVRLTRDTNPARFGNAFKSGRDIHVVAEDVVAIDDDIAEVYVSWTPKMGQVAKVEFCA